MLTMDRDDALPPWAICQSIGSRPVTRDWPYGYMSSAGVAVERYADRERVTLTPEERARIDQRATRGTARVRHGPLPRRRKRIWAMRECLCGCGMMYRPHHQFQRFKGPEHVRRYNARPEAVAAREQARLDKIQRKRDARAAGKAARAADGTGPAREDRPGEGEA